jgi:hypothetical protein
MVLSVVILGANSWHGFCIFDSGQLRVMNVAISLRWLRRCCPQSTVQKRIIQGTLASSKVS